MAIRFFIIEMFIEVHDDVLRKALKPSDNDNEQAVEALRHLLWSIRRNRHLIFFPSLSQSYIDRLGEILNSNEIIAISHSFSKRQDLRSISGLLRFRVIVSFEIETKRIGDVIQINPRTNKSFELFEECHLLTENILDAEFYKYFAIAYQKKNRINECAFQTCYYSLQGGGATTKQVFLYECKLGHHLCLAILDSDKKWPSYNGYGPTAQSLIDEYNTLNGGLTCHYYVMNETNEVENLIPIEIMNVFSTSKQKLFLSTYPAALPWFDFKKGLEYRLLYDKDEAFNEWKKVFTTIDWARLANLKSSSSGVDEFLSVVNKNGFQPIVEPWGASLLENVLYPSKHRYKYNLKTVDIDRLSESQKKEWLAIGSLIFNWCCCFGRKIF